MEPLVLEFDVRCSAAHAFATWTEHIDQWWPDNHRTAGPDAHIVMESGVDGRIYEQTPAGIIHEWGRVRVWDPPRALRYDWHIGADVRDATDVEVSFRESNGTTSVRIEHGGWERVADAAERRSKNRAGWADVVPHFVRGCEGAGALS